jgi:uncharacterized protein (DUF433 family)
MNTDLLIRASESDLFVGESRVLLRNIVTARARGETPEQIQANFPTLSLAQVHGAIVYYLEHQEELDARFAEEEHALDEAHAENRAANADFFNAMRARLEARKSQDGHNGQSSEPPQA